MYDIDSYELDHVTPIWRYFSQWKIIHHNDTAKYFLCLLHCIGVDHLISSGSGQLLCIRRCGDLLPLHEVRSPVHLCPLHDHPNGARRGPEEGVGDTLWNAAHGTGFPWKHCLPKQTGGCEFVRRYCRVSMIHVMIFMKCDWFQKSLNCVFVSFSIIFYFRAMIICGYKF